MEERLEGVKVLGSHITNAVYGTDPPYRFKFSIVTCARWEENDLAEWIEYHKSIGFSHIYLYSNDADPLPTLNAILPYVFGDDAFVTFKHFPKWDHRPQQPSIYYHFLSHYKQHTEWFSFLDVDEFFVLKGLDDIKQFMIPYENHYDAVYFNWVIYGHADKDIRDNDSILLSHTRRSRTLDPHTKVLTRSCLVDAGAICAQYEQGRHGFWHFWDQYDLGPARLVNVLRENMKVYSKDFPHEAYACIKRPGVAERIISKAYIAHFQFKSAADFKRRIDRGGSLTVPFWRELLEGGAYKDVLKRGHEVEDTYLAEYWLGRAGEAYDILLPERPVQSGEKNVALRKPSSQSSIRKPLPDDPENSHRHGHANNGVRTGSFGLMTDVESGPWWKVNLLRDYILTELRIYGQSTSELWRAGQSRLYAEASLNGINWQMLARDFTVEPCNADYGPSVVIPINELVVARFLRVGLAGEGSLHFDEIELFGRPS